MPFSIDNTTSLAGFVQFGNGLYVSGWLYVSNNSVDVFLAHSPGGGSSPIESGPILTLPPSQYQLYGTARDPIRSISIRSTVAANPAQFVGVLNEAGVAGIAGGAPILSTLSASGVVTAPGTGMVTGDVSSAGAILAGTGFTIVKNGAGDFTIAFTSPFSATPRILIIGVDNGITPIVSSLGPPVASGSAVRITMGGSNTEWSFIAVATT